MATFDGPREWIHGTKPDELIDAREHPLAVALRKESDEMGEERLRRLMGIRRRPEGGDAA